VHDRLVGVTGNVEQARLGVGLLDAPPELRPAHLGHHHVHHRQVDVLGVFLAHAQGLFASGGFEHPISPIAEDAHDQFAHARLVLHYQNGFGPGHAGLRRGVIRGRRPLASFRQRQINAGRGALTQFALEGNRAAALPDDSVGRGQSQSSALSGTLGGEERLEEVAARGFGHSDAGVGQRDHHVLARTHAQALGGEALVEMHQGGLNGELAAMGHGVARIDRQVHEHLLEPARVGLDGVLRGSRNGHQLDVFADQPPQQFLNLDHQLVDPHGARFERLAAAEGQKLVRQGAAPLRRPPDLLQRGPLGFLQVGPPQQHVAVAGDHREQIIEIVSHTAGQPPYGFHLLCLPELLLEANPLAAHARAAQLALHRRVEPCQIAARQVIGCSGL